MASSGKNRVILFVASSGGLPEDEVTFPKVLKNSFGYKTGLIGKWHLGNHKDSYGDLIHHPLNHGFDYFYGLPLTNLKDFGLKSSVVTSYYPRFHYFLTTSVVLGLSLALVCYTSSFRKTSFLIMALSLLIPGLLLSFQRSISTLNSILMRNDQVIEQPVILEGITSRFVRESQKFIHESIQSNQPFLLMLSFVKVHTAHFPSSKFRGSSPLHGLYGDCVQELDWGVGQVMNSLRHHNIHQNTIVIFTSDNGAHIEEIGIDGRREGGSNGILKGGKTHGAVEGGIRVPTIISWPDVLTKNHQIDIPVSLMDIFPTLIEMISGDSEYSAKHHQNLDGKSMLRLLKGHHKIHHQFLYHYCGTYLHGVTYFEDVNHVWKIYFYTPKYSKPSEFKCDYVCQCFDETSHVIHHDPPLLYNIQNDPSELHEVISSHSDPIKSSQVLKKVLDAVDSHKQSLNPHNHSIESQFNFWNSVWRPDLQPCCSHFPKCSCRESLDHPVIDDYNTVTISLQDKLEKHEMK